jgi:hypothetical protein
MHLESPAGHLCVSRQKAQRVETWPKSIREAASVSRDWLHYGDPALAPICRSRVGSITAIIDWLQYADLKVAPICRSVTGPEEIQQFWSGKSWLRPDDANMLSYDLARILVEQFATDWPAFRNFVLAANIDDSGSAAAREYLHIDLGAAVCAVLEMKPTDAWKPDPATWSELPERGAFRDDA